MVKTRFDALVIGGGPAGVAAAHAMALEGLDVAVLERGEVGRDKACGDMFLPDAIAAMQRMGVSEDVFHACHGRPHKIMELGDQHGNAFPVDVGEAPAWMLARRSIDQALRDHISGRTTIIYQTQADEIRKSSTRLIEVVARNETSGDLLLYADAVVLACGSRNALGHKVGISGLPDNCPAITAYQKKAVSSADGLPGFYFSPDCYNGYLWQFPTTDGGSNIGVGMMEPLNGSYLKTLGERLLGSGDSSIDWRGGALTLWSGRGEKWSHPDGIISCGDAAGLVDQVTGEGLSAAYISGERAGAAIVSYLLSGQSQGPLDDYSRWVKTFFSERYALTEFREIFINLSRQGPPGDRGQLTNAA